MWLQSPKVYRLVYDGNDPTGHYFLVATLIPNNVFQDSESWMSVVSIFVKNAP